MRYLTAPTGALLLAAFPLAGSLLAQAPDPVFDAPILVTTPETRIDTLVDVDRDGLPDAICFWVDGVDPDQGTVRWMRNLGGMEFGPEVVLQTKGIATNQPDDWMLPGDFNGDGIEEFVRVGPQALDWWRIGGVVPVQQPQAPVPSADATDFILGAVAGDFNGDGMTDVAFHAFRVGGPGSLVVMRSSPTGAFTDNLRITLNPAALEVIDADGDGDDDLVAVEPNSATIFGADGPSLSVQAVLTHTLFTFVPLHVAAGDVDGDGLEDIAVFGSDANGEPVYVLHRRTGAASFIADAAIEGGPASHLADLDGDGDLDGLCCGGGGGPIRPTVNDRNSKFHISWNENGVLSKAMTIPGMGSRRLAGIVDADGDGDLDLLGGIALLRNEGFDAARDLRGEVAPMVPDVGANLDSIELLPVADQDGDGDIDLLVRGGSQVGGTFRLLRNDASGALHDTPADMPPALPGFVMRRPEMVADFDGDGDQDILVEVWTNTSAYVGLFLMRNDGNGRYQAPANATPIGLARNANHSGLPLSLPTGIAMDVDGDGDLDLATNTTASPFAPITHTCRVLVNNGNGFFDTHVDIPGMHLFGAADLDGDGNVDLYGFLQGVGNGVLRGFGGANYGSVWHVGQQFEALGRYQVLQMDGDPRLEIVDLDAGEPILNQPAELFLREFTGTGMTARQPLNILSKIPYGLRYDASWHFGDLNGDGLKDFIGGPIGVPSIRPLEAARVAAIVLATAPGVFGDPIYQVMDTTVLADMDMDGDLDTAGERTWFNIASGDFPAVGIRQQFGAATFGSGGGPAVLGVAGPLEAGSVSRVLIQGGPQAIGAVLALSTVRASSENVPAPNLTLYVDPQLLWSVPMVDGAGVLDLPVPAALAGLRIYGQAVVFDPVAPGGLVQTNGLELVHAR